MFWIDFRKVFSQIRLLKPVSTYHSDGGFSEMMKISYLNLSFLLTLAGNNHLNNLQLLFSSIIFVFICRTLKPFIRRDYESRPLKLKLLEEIRSKCSDAEVRDRISKPIDYCYVQPHHIAAVNTICKEFFWSGIDGTIYSSAIIIIRLYLSVFCYTQ